MGRPRNFSREEVLQKALPLFWENGFADTSLQDIEKATGVNKSGLYSEFESKEELFLACLQHYLASRNGKSILLQEPLGWENIRSFLAIVHVQTAGQRGCFAMNSTREFSILPPAAMEMVGKNISQLRSWIVKNIQAERTKSDPEMIADMIQTFFAGLCVEQNMRVSKKASTRKIENFMHVLRAL